MNELLERIKGKEVFVKEKDKLVELLKLLRDSQEGLIKVNIGVCELLVKRAVLVYVLDFILEDYENLVVEYETETKIFKQIIEKLLKEEYYDKEVKQ